MFMECAIVLASSHCGLSDRARGALANAAGYLADLR